MLAAAGATRVYGNAGYQAALKAVEAISKRLLQAMGVVPDEIDLGQGGGAAPAHEGRLT